MKYAIGIAVGYLLGRQRPYERLFRWNWKRTTFGPSNKYDWYLWGALHPKLVGKALLVQRGWMKAPEKPKPIDLNDIIPKKKG